MVNSVVWHKRVIAAVVQKIVRKPVTYPLIPSAHFSKGRGGNKPLWIFIHTMECGESENKAAQVANWFAGKTAPQASAHYCVDDKQIYQCVAESDTAWSVDDFDTNQKSISIELAGAASQALAQWGDPYSKAQMALTQKLVADICKRNKIPLRRITPAYINSNSPGIGGHIDVTQAKKIVGGHTDPGINYPYLTLISGAKAS